MFIAFLRQLVAFHYAVNCDYYEKYWLMVWPFTETTTCAKELRVGEVVKRVCQIRWRLRTSKGMTCNVG